MGMLFPKVTSGIAGLDEMLGGGYTKNSIVTVSGSTGSGRTTFATQFLVEGFRQNGEPGLYLSFDEPKFSIFANLSSYNWDLPQMEREKHVVFIEYPHNELSDFMEQEGSLLELIDTLGAERVVFDSITPLALLCEGDARRRELIKLISTIRRWGVTALITAEDMHLLSGDIPRTTVGIEALTDGFVHLGWAQEGTRRLRTLEVVKMRGCAHEHFVRPATITSSGFSLLGFSGALDGPAASGAGGAKHQKGAAKPVQPAHSSLPSGASSKPGQPAPSPSPSAKAVSAARSFSAPEPSKPVSLVSGPSRTVYSISHGLAKPVPPSLPPREPAKPAHADHPSGEPSGAAHTIASIHGISRPIQPIHSGHEASKSRPAQDATDPDSKNSRKKP